MMEPRRLIDDSPDALEAALLRAGRDVSASQTARMATLSALGIAGAAVVAGKGAAAASGWSAQQVVAAGTVAVAATVGVLALTLGGPAPTDTAPASASAAPSSAVAPSRRGPAVALPPVEAAPSASSALDADAAARPAAPGAATTRPGSGSIAEEVRSLDAARSALTSGDATGALAKLDEHARRFPHGGLSLEAEVLRIEALAKSGNQGAAAARGRAFIARHPQSVYTPRVRRIVGE